MSLQDQAKEILNDFDNISSDKIIEILNQIQPCLKSEITQDYLKGKINGVLGMTDEAEKKKFCKILRPYLDWYVQGNV
ncbi:hypothetical protein [Nitrosarchaeum sp. AC2]|uniref:hypothetical protein n=1 Tax=Nitrosarchaeum sp. AC2 TaxID=2259673 RepID=UPI0015C6CA23|nr:hypothetical protein [Nitrosarchaeum sp. AC2]QLH10975.1 hypothetical protein DSQ20_05450 [Nitrosarchaeum sp. AC2]